MVSNDELARVTHPLDFFVSYSPTDERWASWIAWTLEEVGYRVVIQAWDFIPGTNFVDFMNRGITDSAAVIAVLSDNYRHSRFGRMEWQAALRRDAGALLTVRVEDVPLEGLLAPIASVDLVNVADEAEARQTLLVRIRQVIEGRARPERAPGHLGRPDGGSGPAPATSTSATPRAPIGAPDWGGRRGRATVPPRYPPNTDDGAASGDRLR